MNIKQTAVTVFFAVFLFSFSSYAKDSVTLQLNWKYQFEFAGYIAAKEKGFYKQAGLDVKMKEYNGGSVVDTVLNGKANFGVTDSELFAFIAMNKPVVLLANFFKRSPLVLATKPNILTPLDLKNKIIMAGENEFKFTSLGLMLNKFHINTKDLVLKKGTYSIEPFANGKVDAMAIYLTNQPYELNNKKIKYNIIDPANYGIFTYSGNLFTSKTMFKEHPKIVERFVDATIRGWRYALNHQKEIVNIIYKKYSTRKSISALMFEANAIDRIMMRNVFRIGYVDKDVVQSIIDGFEAIVKKHDRVNLDDFLYQSTASKVFLNRQLKFIKKHKVIRICIKPDWIPIEYIQDDKPHGISIGVLKKISKISGLKFELVKTDSWLQSKKYLYNKKCDLLPAVITTNKKPKYALLTKPYINFELFMFAKKDKGFAINFKSLVSKPMARKKGSGIIKVLKEKYPNINILETNSCKESFDFVDNGKAYYTISTLPVAQYYIKKYGYNDIVIIGNAGLRYKLSMAVRDDMPQLVDIINSCLPSISSSDIDSIYTHQINDIKLKQYNQYIINILIIVAIVVLILFAVIYVINKKNAELKSVKYSLEESLNSLEKMKDVLLQGIIIYQNGVCVNANRVALKTLGYTKDEIVGKGYFDLISNKYRDIVEEALNKDLTDAYEIEMIKKDRTTIYTLAKGGWIDIKGKRSRVGSFVDITHIKKLEEELKNINDTLGKRVKEEVNKNRQKDNMMMQQSKMASMGELLSMIAHQWRQPLNAISVTINSLLLKVELGNYDEKLIKEKIESMSEYIKHLSETIDDFRNFFKPDKQKESVCIDDIIKSVLKIIKESIISKGINIELELNCKTYINTYPNELKHVVMNLINNAQDALEEREIQNPSIKISTLNHNGYVVITIEDNAGGIDKSIMDRIFEPYFSTKSKKEGTGLGLYMSKIMVEEHLSGKLNVENTKYGAKFTVTI